MIQLQVLNKVLIDKSAELITNYGLDINYFSEYQEEYEFIYSHFQKYGNVPDDETVLEHFNGFNLIQVDETNEYLLDKINEEYIYNQMVPIINDAAANMSIDSKVAVQELLPKVESLLQHQSFTGAIDIALHSKSRLEWAKERKSADGMLGLSTGIDYLDDITGGLLPGEELFIFAARPGVGKSWILDKVVQTNWSAGKTCLLYSGEMGEHLVGARIDTFVTQLSNSGITRGTLKDNDWQRYEDHIEAMSENGTPLYVITPKMLGGKKLTPAILDTLIKRYKPDLVALDQLSLMDESIPSRDIERIKRGKITKELIEISSTHKIPIVAVSQASRAAKESETGAPSLEHLAESDAIGQDATRVVGLATEQVEDMLILTFNIAKNRYGVDSKIIEYMWDIDTGTLAPISVRNYGELEDGEENDYQSNKVPPSPFKDKTASELKRQQSMAPREGVEAF